LRSFEQVRAFMTANHRHLRAMRLLPFAAAGRMMDGSAWLVVVVGCCASLGEQVALPRDELLHGFRGSAGDFLDRGGHAVIPILAM
jgi:hypothetical protein